MIDILLNLAICIGHILSVYNHLPALVLFLLVFALTLQNLRSQCEKVKIASVLFSQLQVAL